MAKYVLLNTTISWNKGSAAQVSSTVKDIRSIDPGAEFVLISYCNAQDQRFSDRYGVRVVGYDDDQGRSLGDGLRAYALRMTACTALAAVVRAAGRGELAGKLSKRERFCAALMDSDLVIDLSGDSLSDKGSHSMVNLMGILACHLIGRPVVFHSQSIGPFSRMTRPIAAWALRRANHVNVREEISSRFISEMGIPPEKTGLHSDCAFNLDAASRTRTEEILRGAGAPTEREGPLVGLSISALMIDLQVERGQGKCAGETPYMKAVTAIASSIIKEVPGSRLVLVPHVIAPTEWARDDRWACREMAQGLPESDRIHLLTSDYTAEELKGVIGACDFFVGSRMHACIAAISQAVPTVALSWSHKYIGIMKRMGMENYVIDTDVLSAQEVASRVMKAFDDRTSIGELLRERLPREKASASEGVRQFVSKSAAAK